MLKFTGNELFIKGYGKIKKNDVITDEKICESFKGRTDFVNVEPEVEEIEKPIFKPTPKPKPKRIARSKRKY